MESPQMIFLVAAPGRCGFSLSLKKASSNRHHNMARIGELF